MKEAIERAKAVSKRIREDGTRKYTGLDKRVAKQCIRSFERLLNTVKRFKSTREISTELRSNSPAWFQEVGNLFDEMERAVKKAQDERFYSPRKELPPTKKWRPGSDVGGR